MKQIIDNWAFKYNYDLASVGATKDPISVELEEEGYAIIYPLAPFAKNFDTPIVEVHLPNFSASGTLKEVTKMISRFYRKENK